MWDGIINHKKEAERASSPGEVVSYKLSPEELAKYRSLETKQEVKKVKSFHKTGRVRKDDEKMSKPGLTKETYLKLRNEGKTNKEIMKMFDMHNAGFYKLKNEWGLVNNQEKEQELLKTATDDQPKKEEAFKELNEDLKQFTTVHESPEEKYNVTDNKCNCKLELQTQLLQLQSELDQQKKNNDDLVKSISALQKYKTMYFSTAKTLKVHLP